MGNKPFHKSYVCPRDLISLLRKRGLTIDNEAKVEQYLSTIGYYRLSAYMYPFLSFPKSEHKYKPYSSFRKVMMLYRFDKKLILLQWDSQKDGQGNHYGNKNYIKKLAGSQNCH